MWPLGILESVLFVVRIEVRARRLEVRTLALARAVNVERVLPWSKPGNRERNLYALRRLRELRRAHFLPLGIRYSGLRGRRRHGWLKPADV